MIYTLDDSSPCIIYLKGKDKRLAKIITEIGPLSFSLHEDGYSFLVHEIIEQMLSIKAGYKIYSRVLDLCDGEISPSRIAALSESSLASAGMSRAKAEYIMLLTEGIMNGSIDLSVLPSLSDSEVHKYLTKLRGIGSWTAKMYLIFVLGRENILPFEDGAFIQVYKWLYKTDAADKQSVMAKCKKWSPYSSIAARYFYRALDSGMTKEPFHLYK